MTKTPLTLGKYRTLQRCSTSDGRFTVLAIDHQDALRRALRPAAPESLSTEEITQFKLDVVAALSPLASGILLDPLYGAAQAISTGVLAHAGLLLELERADYQMNPLPLELEIDPEWHSSKIKRMGADGVKLFFYYNPAAEEHAARQEQIVAQVVDDCRRFDLALYAEPIFYPHAQSDDKREGVIGAARRIAQLGADVLKLEFPVDVNQVSDEGQWAQACRDITGAIDVPWVLLSAGVHFELFTRQLKIACESGAAGFIVGRALWGDAAQLEHREARLQWLQTEGRRRLDYLSSIAALYADSWQSYYDAPGVSTAWFRDYARISGEKETAS